ncbi:MAG: lytic transglycosylase domain-containing protein [Candidatus Limnocylindria bacterium]
MRGRAELTAQAARGERAPTAGRRAGRRRSAAILLGVLGVVTVVAIVVRPMVDDALKEITLPLRHEDVIRQQARDKNLDPALIAAVIYRESKFRDVTSKAGAKGLMQILPDTAHFIARESGGTEFEQGDLADPQINISYGSWYLRYLLDRYEGNTVAAVAAYNAGHGRVDEWGGKGLTVDDIRFVETADYTRDVIDKRGDYARKYSGELGL